MVFASYAIDAEMIARVRCKLCPRQSGAHTRWSWETDTGYTDSKKLMSRSCMSSRDPCLSADNVHGTPAALEPRGFPRLADGLFHVQLTPNSRQVRHLELSAGSILHPRPLL